MNMNEKIRQRVARRGGFTLIELMVVIGIVALLIATSSAAFFGGTQQDSVTKGRDQLRDMLYLARQEACISGKTQLLICWNAQAEIKVGKETERIPQGRYALFEYIGNVWKAGNELCVPFRLQRDMAESLKVGTRLVSLADPSNEKFARVSELLYNNRVNDEDTQQTATRNIIYKYLVGGEEGAETLSLPMTPIAKFSGSLASVDGDRIPLAVRTSTLYHLPQYYQFAADRSVFIFTPDGALGSASQTSITANPPDRAANDKAASFSISVSGNGDIKVQQ